MDRIPGKIGLTIFLLLNASITAAGNLCNSNCVLSIAFPAGGSIEAIEPVTITSGNGGLVDTSGSVTAYLNGETLDLNANESIAFGNGGIFDIGTDGNISFTNLAITTDGTIILDAVGGDEQIQVLVGEKLSLLGGALLETNSSIKLEGSLEIDSGASINIVGSAAPTGCEIKSLSGANLTMGMEGTAAISNTSTCNDIYTLFANSSLSGSGSLLVVDTDTNTSFGTLTLADNNVDITAGSLTLNETEDEASAGTFDIYFVLLLCTLWIHRYIQEDSRRA